jgi:hypothetical protein
MILSSRSICLKEPVVARGRRRLTLVSSSLSVSLLKRARGWIISLGQTEAFLLEAVQRAESLLAECLLAALLLEAVLWEEFL